MAGLAGARFGPQLRRDFQNLGQPLQNFGGGAPGESQWFLNSTPNMRRDFGHQWPNSPLQPPPTMQPDSRMPTHDPMQMMLWPWLYPQQRGRT